MIDRSRFAFALCTAALFACSSSDANNPPVEDSAAADTGATTNDAGADTSTDSSVVDDSGEEIDSTSIDTGAIVDSSATDTGAAADSASDDASSVDADANETIADTGPSCTNSTKDGDETDVDCGGSCPQKCATTNACKIDADCAGARCSAGHCAAVLSFGATTKYPTGGNDTWILAVADFDGDKQLDVAAANQGGSDVSILIGDGHGVFAANATRLQNFGQAQDLLAFDIDADKDVDLVGAGIGDVNVYTNDGHASFTRSLVGANGHGNALAFGDLDGDKGLDLALGTFSSPTIDTLFSNGTSFFLGATLSNPPDTVNGLAIGNLDGKGQGEIVGTAASTLYVFTSSAGVFTAATTTASAGLGRVRLGDVNGDGKLDVVTTIGTSLGVFPGNGDGTLAATPTLFTTSSAGLTDVALGDLDGDGFLDAAISALNSNQPNVVVLLGKGDGTFGAPTKLGNDTSGVRSVQLADVNGDGKLDVLYSLGGATASVGVFLNTSK